jgi:hypothetical protein
MGLNPMGGNSYNWNYSNEERDGFSLELYGTVVAMQEVQATDRPLNGQPGRPKFWPDGKPVFNIRMSFATPEGWLKTFTFGEAGKEAKAGRKRSVHMDFWKYANGDMENLIGKSFHITTWPANPESGEKWGLGNPRLFDIELIEDKKWELNMPLPSELTVPKLLSDNGGHGGQPVQAYQMPQQAPMQVPYQQPPMQGQFYAAPQPMQVPQQQVPMQVPQQYQQPQQVPMQMPYQQPAIQQMPPQQITAQMPQGMDPAVAQAMQAMGAVNVQPVQQGAYDDIPF